MARKQLPLSWKSFLVLLALALVLGGLYRFTDLAKKPMHTDEAILALKTLDYAKSGHFQYDPLDYHGPFLHHAAIALASVRGWSKTPLNEEQVRWVVAIFGMGLILLPLLLVDALGRSGAVIASMLMAVSPMMTYYSRYYIMETPFVFLVGLFVVALWRWSQKRNYLWLLLAGLCLGAMHATKETFVLNLAAMFSGWVIMRLVGGSFQPKSDRYSFSSSRRRPAVVLPWVLITGVAALVSIWLFSSGFQDWQGVTDSVLTYRSYLERAGGSGHEKPWHYYLTLLFYRKDGFIWSEAMIGGLAVVGMASSFFDQRRAPNHRAFLIFLSAYSVILLVLYSAIPYKTPWSILAVHFALALLAGVGLKMIYRGFQSSWPKVILHLFFAAGIFHLCRQTSLATDYAFPGETRYAADERNPYVYTHTSTNLVALAGTLHEIAAVHPDGKNMPLQIIQSEQGWPLPWYLKDMTQVGYQAEMPPTLQAPVVVVDLAREGEARAMLSKVPAPVAEAPAPQRALPVHDPVLDVEPAETPDSILEMDAFTLPTPLVLPPPAPAPPAYESQIFGLRPGVMLALLVRKDLWDQYLIKKTRPLPARRD